MAFSFANVAADLGNTDQGAPGGVQVHDGPELQEIQTDQLGFQAVNGETKLRLLPSPWPSDNLPIPSASLLSVASSQGVLAAAGPDILSIFSTDSIRKTLQEKEGDTIRNASPIVSTAHSRIAHVAFSADESVLVVSEQNNGTITAYQVDQLKDGNTIPALQLSTTNVGLRALIPNPAIASACLFAAITIEGQLLLADLAANELKQGSNGAVLMEGVSCLSWSNKGKQLVAGLADGTAVQMKPDGTIAARIPKSTSVPNDVHISGISWLENDSFFVIYTPNTTSTEDRIPPSEYYIITREKSSYTFQKLPEILPGFGAERVPTHHFVTRLRGWKPHIEDLVVLAATSASDIGLISKADHPLSSTDVVTNAFTFTTIDDDRRRAALPLSMEDSSDTSPIGMVLDLSSKETVPRPIPADEELLETHGPVPNLLVLNNEGVLCSWWIIYNDSVKEKSTFSGFASLDDAEKARSAIPSPPQNVSGPVPVNSQMPDISTQVTTSAATPFAKPSTTFGSATTQSGFGTGSGFGTASKIGETKNSWTSTGFGGGTAPAATGSAFGKSGFGQPAFGGPSTIGSGTTPAFGSSGSLGARPAAFGQPAAPGPAFGQSTFGSKPAATGAFGASSSSSPFAATGAQSGTSGFASFAGTGGFGSVATGKEESTSSLFGKPQSTGFGQKSNSDNPFTKASSSSVFGQASSASPFAKSNTFGMSDAGTSKLGFGGSDGFKLGSTFKGDGSAKDDLPKPAVVTGFGASFGNMFGESKPVLSPTRDVETEMDDENDDEGSMSANETERQPEASALRQSASPTESSRALITPPATISQSRATPAQSLSNLFGSMNQQTKTPEVVNSSTAWSFGNVPSTTPKETPAPPKTMFGTKPVSAQTPANVLNSEPVPAFDKLDSPPRPNPKTEDKDKDVVSTKVKAEEDETVDMRSIPEAPLPPDPQSKPGYQTGDTSASSANSTKQDEPPLPPDFLPANKTAAAHTDEIESPDEDEEEEDDDDVDDEGFSSDFDGSGEDVTQDMSPDEGQEKADDNDDEDDSHTVTDQVQTSPESPFQGDHTRTDFTSPTGGLFTKVTTNQQQKPNRPLFGEIGASGPIFPPPKPQESPRSPSPVRQLLPRDSLRHESRSVSAPARPRSAIDQRKSEYSQSAIAAQAMRAKEEEAARERARFDAVRQSQEHEKVMQLQSLEDHEDERIHQELAQPITPLERLDAFITYQPGLQSHTSKADIPAQIERLYQDINSMIYTLGINARSLSSFMMYQKGQQPNQSWPGVLQSETPLDALNDEWFLDDIESLGEGSTTIEQRLESLSLHGIQQKLERNHHAMTQDISSLRGKVFALRKSLRARTHGNSADAPLSAEQASIQHDLRKATAAVQTKLVKVEDGLGLLRARLSETTPTGTTNKRDSKFGGTPQKKPTVEAVSNTIAKMTSMAEKKSADVDVLESQLKKLGLTSSKIMTEGDLSRPSTPQTSDGRFGSRSVASSVYHTPGSRVESLRATPLSHGGHTQSITRTAVSREDKERWQAKARRKKDIASALRSVLRDKRSQSAVSA